MKFSIFKKILLAFAIFSALIPACFAQQASENQPAQQNVEASNNYENLSFMNDENSAASSQSSSGGMLVRTLGAMILIVGLIFFGAWGLKKLGFGNAKASGDENAPDLTVLSSVSLGSGRTISTVRFGEKVLLVGSTAQSFTLLADESENDAAEKAKPRSVAEMLAEEEDSFADQFERAELNLSDWETEGERI